MLHFNGTVIFVKDMEKARVFYEGLLGQKPKWIGDGYIPYESNLYLWDEANLNTTIFSEGDDPAGNNPGKRCFELYFEDDELEALEIKMKAAGVSAAHPLREMAWGQKVLRVYDPEGNLVEIGEPLETFIGRFLKSGMSVEDTAKRTFTTVDIVQDIASHLSDAQ